MPSCLCSHSPSKPRLLACRTASRYKTSTKSKSRPRAIRASKAASGCTWRKLCCRKRYRQEASPSTTSWLCPLFPFRAQSLRANRFLSPQSRIRRLGLPGILFRLPRFPASRLSTSRSKRSSARPGQMILEPRRRPRCTTLRMSRPPRQTCLLPRSSVLQWGPGSA